MFALQNKHGLYKIKTTCNMDGYFKIFIVPIHVARKNKQPAENVKKNNLQKSM